MKTPAIALLTALALLLALLPACSSGGEVSATQPQPIAVTASTVLRSALESRVRFSGRLVSQETVMVTPKLSGRVQRVAVSVGDAVRAGQALFTFETVDIQTQLNTYAAAVRTAQAGLEAAQTQSGGSLEQAEVQLRLAEESLRGMEALFEAGGVSQIELDQARASYDLAQATYSMALQGQGNSAALYQAQLEQAQAAYSAAALQLSYATVTAPISGVVTMVNVKEHEMTSSAVPGVVLSGEAGLSCEFGVTQAYLAALTVGDEVLVDDLWPATITELPELPDSSTGLYTVKAALAGEAEGLTAGASVTASVAVDTRADAISVPLDALRNDTGGDYVYTVSAEGLCEKRYVTPGLLVGDRMELLEGLEEGMLLVTSWSPLLAEGERLQVVEGGV